MQSTKGGTSPGPGNYEIDPIAFDAKRPRFHVGQKFKEAPATTTNVPGAGSYDPSPERTKTTLPSYSMKLKLENTSSIGKDNKVPGPGNYEAHLKNKRDAPQYGFGSSTREDGAKKLNVPGPGSYKINSAIADLPAYAMPGTKSQEFKYI